MTRLAASLHSKQPTPSVYEASRLYRTSVTAGTCTRFGQTMDCRRIVNNFFIYFERSPNGSFSEAKQLPPNSPPFPLSDRLFLFFEHFPAKRVHFFVSSFILLP
jgi:hypothetical protein